MAETSAAELPNAPAPGQDFGGFRILRLLGRGGMGAVYEAESLEDGRRLAIKVLTGDLAGPVERKRFLREGQLAASLNHPNTVYIYGTDEVNGVPTIAMELVAGGTLEDKVKEGGSLDVAEAVEVALQMIDGLAAAYALGILHRDIKPSNCFVGLDGTIKVGDFGLSKSVAGGEESKVTRTGVYLGTPAYSAPEQLLGEPQDVRSDIYSVGATLYYLLTARLPFEAPTAMNMVAAVLQGSPDSPKKHRPEIPERLAQIVSKCLQRKPDDRYATYDELRRDLDVLRERDVVPASVMSRLGAFSIDFSLMLLLMGALQVIPFVGEITNDDGIRSNAFDLVMLWVVKGVPESLWGVAAGKGLLGLKLEQRTGGRLGWTKCALRVVLIWLALSLGLMVSGAFPESVRDLSETAVMVAGLLALMLPMRRLNGYAALHDQLAGSRVVRSVKRVAPAPMTRAPISPEFQVDDAEERIGPFVMVRRSVIEGRDGVVDLAFDPVLRRSLWVHRRPAGAAPLPAVRRDLARTGRLRWVASRRRDEENWDAYDAPDGSSLLDAAVNAVSWKTVLGWLRDVADEFRSAQRADEHLDLSLDRIWVSRARAIVMDFSAGATIPESDRNSVSAGESMRRMARRALAPASQHWPVLPQSVRALLDQLPTITDSSAIVSRIDSVAELPPVVSRRTRGIAMALSVAAPIAFAVAFWAFVSFDARVHPQQAKLEPFLDFLDNALPRNADSARIARIERRQRVASIYLLSQHGAFLADSTRSAGLRGEGIAWARVDSLLSRHRNFTASDSASAARTVEQEWKGRVPGQSYTPAVVMGLLVGAAGILMTAVVALVWALAAGVGVTARMAGIDVVTESGVVAGRWRLLLRTLLIWLPVFGAAAMAWWAVQVRRGTGDVPVLQLTAGAVLVLLGCITAVVALVNPQRGIVDRLTGTWLVPR